MKEAAMPVYSSLRIRENDAGHIRAWKKRTAEKLLVLRGALDAHIADASGGDSAMPVPERNGRQWLRLATWNLREFDTPKYGGRLKESLYFIAEIISHFDIVALQEVREDLGSLRVLMEFLGEHEWGYIATDVTEGSSGNRERMVFVFQKNRVRFTSIAGEVVLDKSDVVTDFSAICFRDTSGLNVEFPEGSLFSHSGDVPVVKSKGKTFLQNDLEIPLPEGTRIVLPKGSSLVLPRAAEVPVSAATGQVELDFSVHKAWSKQAMVRPPADALTGVGLQFARSPFLVTFQAGWLKFILCTVHIYYGTGREGMVRRNEEIRKLTRFLSKRAESEHDSDAENFFFVLGDFNIVGKEHVTWQSLHSNGFRVPDQLRKIPVGSNVARDKAYDQIAFWQQPVAPHPGATFIDVGNAGIFDYFRYVFRRGADDPDGEDELYYAEKTKKYKLTYKEWRTYQMSDHLPMWIELRTDFGADYLSAVSVSD
ncbi:endonuclease/exonuclease/phosphatase family protein [Chlorobium sp.]|uniref:endonuclease/exonuclease/phosphatase family protein n=1 Tax=Chlorobium sp. TaxID=1095 RepID=UPI0025BCC989|nr:endonuclease/exonuclease/phosphatase family protein [Chlorobium sp.]